MPTELFANGSTPGTNLTTTLSAAISTTNGTSLTVAASTGFPGALSATSTTQPVPTQFRILIDSELLIVTNVSGTTWTVTRGAEGSTAATHASGATVTHVLTRDAGYALTPAVPQPWMNGHAVWSFDPNLLGGGTDTTLTAGVLYLTRVPIPQTFTCSVVDLWLSTVGATLTNSFLGLYDNTGARLVGSADQSSAWAATTNTKSVTLSSATVLTGGPTASVFVGLLVGTATTMPKFRGFANASGYMNAGPNASTAAYNRAGSSGTSQTALPASVTLTGIAAISPYLWIGLR